MAPTTKRAGKVMVEEKSETGRGDKSMLDLFWSLANHSDDTREIAATQLIRQLIKKQNDSKDDEICSDLSYSLKRLVDGLSSTNKATRLGYYVALVEMLRSFPKVLSPDDNILPLIDEHLVKGVGAAKKKSNETAIGQSLAYGALIRSGRIYESTAAIQNMTEGFVNLFAKAEFLQEMCGTLLIELLTKVHEERFRKCVFSILSPLMSSGWEHSTPDVFRVTLALSLQFPNTVNRSFLQQHWLCKQLLDPYRHNRVCTILFKSTKTLPRIHPVCKEVIANIMVSAHLASFWTTISNAVSDKSQKEHIYLFCELIKESLSLVTKSSQIKDILQPAIIRILMTCLANKKLSSHMAAADLSKFIVNFASTSEHSKIQMEVLNTLLTFPGSILFDQISSAPVISGIIPHLHGDAIVSLITLLKRIFYGLSTGPKQQSEVDKRTHRIAVLQKLANIVGCQSVRNNEELTMDVLQFLVLHSFFDQLGTSSEIQQCSFEPVSVSPDVHKAARTCFFKALTVSRIRLNSETNVSLLNHRCLLLDSVLSYVQQLLGNPKTVTPVVPFNEKTQATFAGIFDSLRYLKKRGARDGELQKSQAFQILFLNFGLQLFVDPTRTIELVEDLHVCSKKAFEKFTLDRKRQSTGTVSSGGDLEWMQVVMDVLLSILSENSSLLRSVASNVFSLLVPQMSLAAFRQILDVLRQQPASEGNEDSDGMDGETSLESGIDDDESESSEEEEDDDVDGNDEDSNQSLRLRKSVKAALGDAAARSDAEEDESDIGDDAMMHIDDLLAEAFKSIVKKKPGVSKDDESLLHFQCRCLDLLNIVINRRPSLDFVLESLGPLISVAELGLRDKFRQSYSLGALHSIKHLMTIKKFQTEDFQSTVNVVDILNLVIGKFKNALDQSVSQTFSELGTFLVKCAEHIDKLPSTEKSKLVADAGSVKVACIEVYAKSLKDFFLDRSCSIPPQMFMSLINKKLEASWKLSSKLLKFWVDENVPIFKRCHATYLLVGLTTLSKEVSQFISNKRWKKFAHACISNSVQELNKIVASDLKMKYAENMLQLMCNVFTINKLVKLEIEDTDELTEMLVSLNNVPGIKDLRRLIKKLALLINFALPEPKIKVNDQGTQNQKHKLDEDDDHEQTNGTKKKSKKKKKTETASSL